MNRPCASCDPLPHWIRQLEKAVSDQAGVLQEGHGMVVILEVRPGGRIETQKVTIKYGRLDK